MGCGEGVLGSLLSNRRGLWLYIRRVKCTESGVFDASMFSLHTSNKKDWIRCLYLLLRLDIHPIQERLLFGPSGKSESPREGRLITALRRSII
jgi:hypothetical protein